MITTWLIIAGNMATNFGNSMYVVALLIFFTDRYPQPMNIGSLQAATYLPIVLFSVLGGRIADRRDRTRIIAGTDLIRSVLLTAAATAFYFLVDVHPLVIFLPLVFMNAVMHAFFSPAVISYILDRKKTARTDLLSLRTGTGHLAALLGQTLGAALYPIYGLLPLLIINGLCFFGSGLAELFLRENPERKSAQRAAPDRLGLRSIIREFAVMNRRGAPVLLYLGMQAVNSILVLNLPFFLTSRLGFRPEFTGYGIASLLGGSILTGLYLGLTGKAGQVKGKSVLLAGLFFAAICIIAGTLGPTGSTFQEFLLPMALFIAAGSCQGWIHIVTIHMVYETGPRKTAARRQGFLEASAAAVLPVGYILSGIVASALPLDTPWLLRGAALLSFFLVGGALLSRRSRTRVRQL